MKSYTEYLVFNTAKPREIINITRQLEQCLAKSGIKEGLMLVNPMHITASVFINDAEPGLYLDIEELLERLAPAGRPYHHHHTGEDNGDAHLKRQLLGQQVTCPSPQAASTSAPGSRCTTSSSTASARSACWSRPSANEP